MIGWGGAKCESEVVPGTHMTPKLCPLLLGAGIHRPCDPDPEIHNPPAPSRGCDVKFQQISWNWWWVSIEIKMSQVQCSTSANMSTKHPYVGWLNELRQVSVMDHAGLLVPATCTPYGSQPTSDRSVLAGADTGGVCTLPSFQPQIKKQTNEPLVLFYF